MTSIELRRQFGKIISKIELLDVQVLVTVRGKPVAKLVKADA